MFVGSVSVFLWLSVSKRRLGELDTEFPPVLFNGIFIQAKSFHILASVFVFAGAQFGRLLMFLNWLLNFSTASSHCQLERCFITDELSRENIDKTQNKEEDAIICIGLDQ